jgi:hypothetical protein
LIKGLSEREIIKAFDNTKKLRATVRAEFHPVHANVEAQSLTAAFEAPP